MPQKSTGTGRKHRNPANRRKVEDYTEEDEQEERMGRVRAILACAKLLALLTEHHDDEQLIEAAE